MKTKLRTCALLLSLALAPSTWAAGEPVGAQTSSCPKVKTSEEILSEPPCGNDAACAARKAVELQEALAAHKCEMARLAAQALSPVPLPVATPK